MCFIVFAFDQHPRYQLIFAANRDEFFNRPTAEAHFWPDEEAILAGIDLKGGGTWMGVTQSGRFGALTNVRDPEKDKPAAPTRGALVANYLRGDDEPRDYAERAAATGARYNGFNLLVGDYDSIYFVSNRDGPVRPILPGVYGLSNDDLNVEWPKVRRGKALFEEILQSETIDPEALFALLRDHTIAAEEELPDTGIDREWERMLSPIFINTPMYGTRSSTVLLMDREGEAFFAERTYDASATPTGTQRFTFQLQKHVH